MKSQVIALLSIAVLANGVVVAAEPGGMKMDPAAASSMEKAQVNRAVGVVRAMDADKGTITLSHGAVPAIKWPAMTMAFKVSKAVALGIKPGDRVDFEFVTKGMDATVTKIVVVR
ncbi:MAG: copper-binding protein [Pseudomonadota bacterium]